ncbi:hypothetical protein NX059_000890 [Plenodomus lindquistii]|nr:hypothetical protein NX059_000890 [Plenodomus lindquistii]
MYAPTPSRSLPGPAADPWANLAGFGGKIIKFNNRNEAVEPDKKGGDKSKQ